jgi:hypothetical protein
MDRIVAYCQKDVVTVAQIFLRLIGEPANQQWKYRNKVINEKNKITPPVLNGKI